MAGYVNLHADLFFSRRLQADLARDIQHQVRRARETRSRVAAGFAGSESDSGQEEMTT